MCMYQNVKEIRESTGMSQKAFAELYGSNSPAPYVVHLLARTLPCMNATLKVIHGKNGRSYYYDMNQDCVLDIKGNRIYIQEKLEDIKEQNLVLYLDDLFERFYEIQDKFNRDCKYDKEEDIFWV